MDETNQVQGNASAINRRIFVGLVAVAVLAAAGSVTRRWSEDSLSSTPTSDRFLYPDQPHDYEQIDWLAYEQERAEIAAGGEHYQPLRAVVEIPGISDPELTAAGESTADKALEVIGFKVDGQAYAFCIDAMTEIPRHVVNMRNDNRAIAVSYCDLSDCARVVSSARAGSQPLGIGGLDINDELVLLFGGRRYAHRSAALPMDDVAFERMSLGKWMAKHPGTMVYCDCGAPRT